MTTLSTAITASVLGGAFIYFLYLVNKSNFVIDQNVIGTGIVVAATWLVWLLWR